MKHLGLFLLTLAFVACHDDTPKQPYYITINENKVVTDYAGIQKRIEVTSNCDWSIGVIPKWCIIEKVAVDNAKYLDVQVLPNDTETPREATITLSYSHDRYKLTAAELFISQTKKPEQTELLPWNPLAVNSLSYAVYELLDDNITRRYRILGKKAFITQSFQKQVFLGNLIDYRTDNRTLTDFQEKYTFNPIHCSALVNDVLYNKETKPSFDALNQIAQQIIADLPKQNNKFNYIGPIQYLSHRHLHLLGIGNLGYKLDELISGKLYTQKEMTKKTGMIYSCSQELFSIIMDFPEKLIDETISEQELPNMSYINSIAYGKASVLLIESDDDYVAVKGVVNSMMWGWSLDDEKMKIRNALDVWFVYFDSNGAHVMRGDYTLILNTQEKVLDIIPINFTTNKLGNDSVGNMEIKFELP